MKTNLRNRKFENNSLLLLFILSAFFSLSVSGQNNYAALANADTSSFIPNTQGNWKLYNSYVAKTSDGYTDFEIIVQHDKEGIDWSKEQLIGKIKTQSLLPVQDQNISYELLGVKYMIHISKNGKCFLSLVSGSLPEGDPVIIPVQVKY